MSIALKNKLLIASFILAVIVCYQLAFAETLKVKGQYNKLEMEQLLFENLPQRKLLLQQREKRYDSLLQAYQVSGTSLQNNLLKTIDRFAKINGLKLVKFEEPHRVREGDLVITNYLFSVSGDYSAILALIYQLEQKANFGRIVNLEFENITDFRTRKTELNAHVIIEVVN